MSAETALWSRDSWESDPDTTLLTRAREGSAEAFGELWRRHLPAAYGVAGKHGGRTPPEDIVAEAAAKVFALLQVGRGPDEHFRAYFLTTVRTVAADHTRGELRVAPVAGDDLELLLEPAEPADGGDDADGAGSAGGGESDLFDTALVRTAFSGLPERDQQVLWHTTVEGEAPRVVAPMLGMTAGAVSSRAMRARESLRAGYLDAYAERCLAHAESRECTWTIERLGRLVRGRLPRRQTERAEAHVASCPHAAAVAADLREIHRGFPALVVPLVLAAGFGSTGLAAALGFAGAGVAGAGAAALAAMGEVPVGAGVAATAAAGVTATAAEAGSAAAASGAAVGGAASATGGSGSGPGGAVAGESSQLATRVAVALAAGVVVLGLVGAALTSGQSDAPAPPVAGSAPTALGTTGSEPTPSTSGIASPVPTATTSAPTTTAGTPTETETASVATNSSARSRATTSAALRPASAAGLPPASGVAARLLGAGDPTRISLRVPSASSGGSMTVTVSTASGAGSLTAGNRTFTCSQRSRSSVTCVGDGGQIQLVQSGTGGPVALVVRVRDASGTVRQSVVVPA